VREWVRFMVKRFVEDGGDDGKRRQATVARYVEWPNMWTEGRETSNMFLP
jgi:hypothetical protein